MPHLPVSMKDMRPRLITRHLLAMGPVQVAASMLYIVLMTLASDFERSTYVECGALNIFPSLSSAGRSQPKALLLSCCAQFPFAVAIAWLQLRYYYCTLPRHARLWGAVTAYCLLQVSSIMVLWAITVHAAGNSLFHLVSAAAMFLTAGLYMACSQVLTWRYLMPIGYIDAGSYWLKRRVIFVYFTAAAIMWTCYFLNEFFCFPFCEYETVISITSLNYFRTFSAAYSVFGMGEFITYELFCVYLLTVLWDLI
ncbi:hypothetical protein KR018_006913 [Drosophila ironensis]|nr:hypothetical protein KR018_006913 [Drosophila ironensis]